MLPVPGRVVAAGAALTNKLGIDVPIEALREAWRGERFQLKELNRLAARFRMTRVMKLYLESLLS
jgi:hypothetical protein